MKCVRARKEDSPNYDVVKLLSFFQLNRENKGLLYELPAPVVLTMIASSC